MDKTTFDAIMRSRFNNLPFAAQSVIRCGHASVGMEITPLPGICHSLGTVIDFDPCGNFSTEEMIGTVLIRLGEYLLKESRKKGDPS